MTMDTKTRDLLYSILADVRRWRADVLAGLMPTKESLALAEMELVQAMEPEDVAAAEKPRWMAPELSDRDDYRAVWAGQQAAEALAMRMDR